MRRLNDRAPLSADDHLPILPGSRDQERPGFKGDELERTRELARLSLESSRWRQQAATFDAQIRHQAERLAERREELQSAERRLAHQSKTLSRQQHEQTLLHDAIRALSDERDRWRSSADAAREEADERNNAVSVLTESVSAMKRDLASASLRMSDLDRALDQARHAIAERDDVVALLTAGLSARQNEIASSRAQIAEQYRALAGARQCIAERNEALVALTATLAARQRDLAAARARLRELGDALDDSRRQIASVTGSRAWKLANWIRERGRRTE